jgi:hypothetical protein
VLTIIGRSLSVERNLGEHLDAPWCPVSDGQTGGDPLDLTDPLPIPQPDTDAPTDLGVFGVPADFPLD